MDKALSCMDEAKRKKLEEMVQEAAAAKRSGAAAPARPAAVAAAASRSSSRAPSAHASVSVLGLLHHVGFSLCNDCSAQEASTPGESSVVLDTVLLWAG
jgi:hypothetical protein